MSKPFLSESVMTLHLRPWPRVAGREAGRQRTQFVLRLGGSKSSCHQGRAHLDLALGHLAGNGELGAPGLSQVLWMEELDDVCFSQLAALSCSRLEGARQAPLFVDGE